MARRHHTLFFALLAGIALWTASCTTEPKKDYPKVEIDSLDWKTAQPVGGSTEGLSCRVAIHFDTVRKAADESVSRLINEALMSNLLGGRYDSGGVRQALLSFRADYEEHSRKELAQLRSFAAEYGTPGPEAQDYSIELDNRLIYNTCGIATFRCVRSERAGSAEPEVYTRLLNFDVLTGRLLSLDDLFVEGYEEHIDALLLRKLMSANKVSSMAELEELGYFTSSALYPSSNFCIEGQNLLFLYNPADGIGPYDADAATVLSVELDDLSLIFSPDSPLRRVME